ncbi:LOW QUALITY PROTEIN: uncharacterized protein LOC126797081 [Argentina anserina]|uniref:LOW QUALITY PROTEIN: uncharacterized protein LOC126797081 n=1 Tax=Argentina anserina TaxID=57926 RepID=UPI00217663A2|nr:LOW QUALITY PROTEIN: uncharacterized protein LOC126797081 [Potentilla anserina]
MLIYIYCIAFTVDISLLHRDLRSSVSICTGFGNGPTVNRLQIKLAKKLTKNSTQKLPFLTFETKGYKSAVIQDVPISSPLSRSQVLELQTALDMAQDSRAARAVLRGDAQSVQVSVKHFGKSLQCNLAKPDCAFYGIAPEGACLTLVFQFFIPGTHRLDKSISMHCSLPVLDQGSN